MKDFPSVRQIVVADITRVQTSCGYGVPLFEYQADRDQHIKWAKKQGRHGIKAYSREHNSTSIDDLPAEL